MRKYLLLFPLIVWLLIFMILPYAFILIQSFLETDMFGKVVYHFNLSSYQKIFTSEVYYSTLLRTLWFAVIVAFVCIVISLPLAYYIAFIVQRNKVLIYTLIVLPFWMSYIVRAYAWKIILGQTGILNTFLMSVGLIQEPMAYLLYSDFATILCLVYILMPFVAIPIYTAFEQIPKSLIEASKDLGANGWTTFWKITFPLALPGIISGGTFALVLTMGDFMAAFLLGGPKTLMISNIVTNLFGTSNDRPLGSALGIVILLLILVLLEISSRYEKKYATFKS